MNDRPSWGLVLVRIVVGFVVLSAGIALVRRGFGEDLVTRTAPAYAASPQFVRVFGESVVLAHPWMFSILYVWGQIVCGLCLFLGMLTRPAGIVAAFLYANAWLVVPEGERTMCLILATCSLACAISRAGRRSGADVFLDAKLPPWVTWSRSNAGGVAAD